MGISKAQLGAIKSISMIVYLSLHGIYDDSWCSQARLSTTVRITEMS